MKQQSNIWVFNHQPLGCNGDNIKLIKYFDDILVLSSSIKEKNDKVINGLGSF